MRCGRAVSLLFFACYVALFPGATLTVALDRVPAWGVAFGGLLLVLQGAAVLGWLVGRTGWRGLLVGITVGVLACAIEFIGVTTGFPFGRYTYTDVLQPQVFQIVPLAICAAWIMVVPAALALARVITPPRWSPRAMLLVAATLILLLDLQIETVATRINHYWDWLDTGGYYGVPASNFVAWWLVGFGLAWLVSQEPGARSQEPEITRSTSIVNRQWFAVLARYVPHLLYLLSTLMFAVTNLARGYVGAGIIGVAVLVALGALWRHRSRRIPLQFKENVP